MTEQATSIPARTHARMARFDAWNNLSLDIIKRGVISAFLIGAGMFVLFSLLSYSPSDASWTHVASDTTGITNLMGASGAWFAGVFFAFLGYAAWLLPLFFLYELVNLWWVQRNAPRSLRYPAVLFAVLALAASLALIFPYDQAAQAIERMSAGGIVGLELGQSVSLLVGKWLGLSFTAVLFLVAFSYGFQVKWFELWRSRQQLFAERVIRMVEEPVMESMATTDLTMMSRQPLRQRHQLGTSMATDTTKGVKTDLAVKSPTKSQSILASLFGKAGGSMATAKRADEIDTHMPDANHTMYRQKPDMASQVIPTGNVAVQPASESFSVRNERSHYADADVSEVSQHQPHNHDATAVPMLTKPIPSRPLSQREGVSRGGLETSHHRSTRQDPVFDDLLESLTPVSRYDAGDSFHSTVATESTPAEPDVMETLKKLAENESTGMPTVFGGSQQQGVTKQRLPQERVIANSQHRSTSLASAHLDRDEHLTRWQQNHEAVKPDNTSSSNTIAEKAKRARPQSNQPVKPAAMTDTAESAINRRHSEAGLLRLNTATGSRLGNPSNPNGGEMKSPAKDLNASQAQIDLLQDMPSLVPEPSFSAAAMAVTEGDTPEQMFEELEAELDAMLVEDEAFEPMQPASQQQSSHSLNERRIASIGERSDGVEKPTQPDYFSDTKGSRAFAKAAHRASLPTLPPLELLEKPDPNQKPSYSPQELARLSELLEIKLNEFNIKAKVASAQPGPVVTRFEVDLAPGVKASKVTNISRDLARSLSMASVRVVEVIPGKPYIGIEVPNKKREMVRLYELLMTKDYQDPKAGLSMALGKDIAGRPVVTDLAKAPHMLVAGTTGSGKSVAVNAMLLSLLLKYTPEQLRLILIDPKQLELANYNDIPHLLTEVVTDMKDAASALNWCVVEMERRYKLMAFLKVRKLADYNKKIEAAEKRGEDFLDPLWRPNDDVSTDKPPRLKTIPLVVVVADEFADMIMQVGKQAEELITRLAQKSRAAGIHLILATQRPSVDVITGLIKANIPTRVALRVNSKVDSRTILDSGGAEDMLGNGDMLFLGPGKIEAERAHGAYISDDEVNTICDAWRERGSPDYVSDMFTEFDIDGAGSSGSSSGGSNIKTGETDAFYDEAVAFVMETRKVSASSIQRKFSIGYNRAARIVDAMEAAGLVSSMGKSGKREILM